MTTDLNDAVDALAKRNRLRVMRLEDGELTIPLRGAKSSARFPSDRPHAGLWSATVGYVLIPLKRGPGTARKARIWACLGEVDLDVDDRSSDAEILVLATIGGVERLILAGPPWCKARKRQTARDASRLAAHRFKEKKP